VDAPAPAVLVAAVPDLTAQPLDAPARPGERAALARILPGSAASRTAVSAFQSAI